MLHLQAPCGFENPLGCEAQAVDFVAASFYVEARGPSLPFNEAARRRNRWAEVQNCNYWSEVQIWKGQQYSVVQNPKTLQLRGSARCVFTGASYEIL